VPPRLHLFLLLLALVPFPAAASDVLQFWALGREGETVKALLPEFHRRHPEIAVKLQQVPWSAAHEKLLTGYAAGALPDVLHLGTTWIPEFVALGALEPLRAEAFPADFFPALLAAYRVGEELWCVPWYADTRVLFYRSDLLAQAGWAEPPRDWQGWLGAMAALRRTGSARFAMLAPADEWELPVILGLQQGARLLRDGDRYGDFRSLPFRRGMGFYLDLFRRGLAPPRAGGQVANLYREFGDGEFAVYLSGPWNLGEFRRRLPAHLQNSWSTTPLPAFGAAGVGVSLAGGGGLAITRGSRYQEQAGRLIAYLTETAQQLRFYRDTGDLPPGRSAWSDPLLAADRQAQAFRIQLERLAAPPQIPEWERIAAKLADIGERMVREELTPERGLEQLDRDTDAILEKRRWLLDRRPTR